MTTAYFNNIQDIILQALCKAKERIYVAMAWFTNTTMSNALIECRKRNVSVAQPTNPVGRLCRC